jgi:hypothetical protein
MKVGIESRDGADVGRDPRKMSQDELLQMGHARVSPMRALRLKCLDCCNGSGQEVRLCTAVDCPSWPFRMGKNPWRAPASEAKREHGRKLAVQSASNQKTLVSSLGKNDAAPHGL